MKIPPAFHLAGLLGFWLLSTGLARAQAPGNAAPFDAAQFGRTFQHKTAQANGVKLHYVTGGRGKEVVVLLHGWPETWYTWRGVMPALAEKYTVVAPDIRGYGDSEKPAAGFDKQTEAEDIYQLVRGLGYSRILLVVADMAGPVGYAYCLAHPETVSRFVFIESGVPGFGLDKGMDPAHGGSWHWGFNMVPELPEALVTGRERVFLTYFYRRGTQHPQSIGPADVDEYVRAYSSPNGLTGPLGQYRTIFADGDENQRLFQQKGKLKMPVLAVGADKGLKGFSLATMQQLADNVRGVMVADCGHFLQEDQPAELLKALTAFFNEPAR